MPNDEKKKPLVTLDAANNQDITRQDLAKPDGQMGVDWAGNQSSQQQTVDDGVPTLTGQQVDNIKRTPTGVKMDDINKVPGKSTPTISQSAINSGVLAGAPSNVVIQHMLDTERKPRTPEEQERLEKKRKRDALFAAIGDGISALSNLYFTTKGSPSADQSKSLSKAVHDKAKKEDKEYETAMDRRIRLLKEQRAEYYRNEELKIKQGLAEAEKAAMEAKTANDIKKAEDLMKYYTKKNQILEEEKQAAEQRAKEKAEQEKKESENRIKNRDSRTASQNKKEEKIGNAALSNAASNKKKADADVANKRDMIKKRRSSGGGGGSSKYTGPTYSANYDAKTGELKGYTVKGRGTTPPTKTGGSAKSKFSIHKK